MLNGRIQLRLDAQILTFQIDHLYGVHHFTFLTFERKST